MGPDPDQVSMDCDLRSMNETYDDIFLQEDDEMEDI
jgi:hypothetical protein